MEVGKGDSNQNDLKKRLMEISICFYIEITKWTFLSYGYRIIINQKKKKKKVSSFVVDGNSNKKKKKKLKLKIKIKN